MENNKTHDAIRRDVLKYLAEYSSEPSLRQAQSDLLLSECGLDSFGMFDFVLGLEARFGVKIRDGDLDARRLRSVGGIVDLLLEIYERDGRPVTR